MPAKRQSLVRHVVAPFFAALAAGAGVLGFGSIGLTAAGNNLHGPKTAGLLKTLDSSVFNDLAKGSRNSLPSAGAIERRLSRTYPQVKFIPAQGGYDYLKRNGGGKNGTVFVFSDPTFLELVGRVGREAIVQSDHSLLQDPYVRDIYYGKMNMALWRELVYGDAAGTFLLFLFLIRVFARNRQASDNEKHERWRTIILDEGYGPAEPEYGYRAFLAKAEEKGDETRFYAELVEWANTWGGPAWRKTDDETPAELAEVVVPHSAGIPAAVERWVEFCHHVAAENARRFKLRLEIERAHSEALAEDRRREQETEALLRKMEEERQARELEERRRVNAVTPHLPPMAEVLAGLPPQSSALAQSPTQSIQAKRAGMSA